jgi:adhesin transport system outer membrane protein
VGLDDARLDAAMPRTLDEALSRAKQHPRIAEAQAASSAAFQGVAKAKSQLKPQVGVAVGSGDGGNVQLTFTWKGFDVAARRGVSVASANARAGEYDIADARLRVEEDVRKAWAEMEGASQRQAPAITQVTTGAKVLAAYRDQFLIGRRTLLDLLNASDEVYSNQLSALQADMELRVARYRVVSALGGLAERY